MSIVLVNQEGVSRTGRGLSSDATQYRNESEIQERLVSEILSEGELTLLGFSRMHEQVLDFQAGAMRSISALQERIREREVRLADALSVFRQNNPIGVGPGESTHVEVTTSMNILRSDGESEIALLRARIRDLQDFLKKSTEMLSRLSVAKEMVTRIVNGGNFFAAGASKRGYIGIRLFVASEAIIRYGIAVTNNDDMAIQNFRLMLPSFTGQTTFGLLPLDPRDGSSFRRNIDGINSSKLLQLVPPSTPMSAASTAEPTAPGVPAVDLSASDRISSVQPGPGYDMDLGYVGDPDSPFSVGTDGQPTNPWSRDTSGDTSFATDVRDTVNVLVPDFVGEHPSNVRDFAGDRADDVRDFVGDLPRPRIPRPFG